MNFIERFQSLLRELFEFELADLDFGIYRIINHKRQIIERWIEKDLPEAIKKELRQGALAEQVRTQQSLEKARQKVLETLGEDALDTEGNLAEQFVKSKVGQEYLEARSKAINTLNQQALEAQVYNHLYTFFSRYYQGGDFISKRRYAKRSVTPSHTTARRFTSIGPTTTSTTSRLPSSLTITPGRLQTV